MPNSLPKDPLELQKVALYIQNYMEGFVFHHEHELDFTSGLAQNNFHATTNAIRKSVTYGVEQKTHQPQQVFAYCFNQAGLQDAKPRRNIHDESWIECMTQIVKSPVVTDAITNEKTSLQSALLLIALSYNKNKDELSKNICEIHTKCQQSLVSGYRGQS